MALGHIGESLKPRCLSTSLVVVPFQTGSTRLEVVFTREQWRRLHAQVHEAFSVAAFEQRDVDAITELQKWDRLTL